MFYFGGVVFFIYSLYKFSPCCISPLFLFNLSSQKLVADRIPLDVGITAMLILNGLRCASTSYSQDYWWPVYWT